MLSTQSPELKPLLSLAFTVLGLAGFQALMVWRNLGLYTEPGGVGEAKTSPALSVLIPARDEAHNIAALLESLENQQGCLFEVLVLDDNSSDQTSQIVEGFAARDERFRLHHSAVLPAGWAGKQFACHQLSQLAKYEHWLFLDADLVVTDDWALARVSSHLEASGSVMLSAVPLQVTRSWAEDLVIPLIHHILLAFLPIWEMRRNKLPALGAACGQIVALKGSVYQEVGGHQAVRHRLHDATALAAHFREQGHMTDIFDATNLAQCRMYQNAAEVISGFGKNATEAMAKPLLLPICTLILLGANVLPWLLPLLGHSGILVGFSQLTNIATFLILRQRFRQSYRAALARPLGVILFLVIQWLALISKCFGGKASWKGRVYERTH